MFTNHKSSLTVLVVLAVLLVATGVFTGASARQPESAGVPEQTQVARKVSGNTYLAPVQGRGSPAALEGRYSPTALRGFGGPAALQGRYSPAALQYNVEAPLAGRRTPAPEMGLAQTGTVGVTELLTLLALLVVFFFPSYRRRHATR